MMKIIFIKNTYVLQLLLAHLVIIYNQINIYFSDKFLNIFFVFILFIFLVYNFSYNTGFRFVTIQMIVIHNFLFCLLIKFLTFFNFYT